MFSRRDKGSVRTSDTSGSDRRARKFERHVVEEIVLTDTSSARAAVKRERWSEFRLIGLWLGLWLMLTLAAVFGRGPWPLVETRFMDMAQDMWTRHQFMLPALNGEAQFQSPLYFWLVQIGWKAFGVSDAWMRVVSALGVLASLLVIQRLAHLLWLREAGAARHAPLIFLGTLSVSVVTGVATADAWQLFFVLLAFWGLFLQWRRSDMRAWMLTALALALGVLTSGPLMPMYVLPVALLAPLWARSPRPQWKYWYVDVIKACAVAGVALALWLLMVSKKTGAAYAIDFLLASANGPALDLFRHTQPVWWFVWMTPVMFFPWSVLPLVWMRWWHIRREPIDEGTAFILCWIVTTVAWLSLLPVKQPHYLLPLVPAGALLTSRLLMAEALRRIDEDSALAGMAAPVVAIGGAMMVLPRLPHVNWLPELLWRSSPWLGVVVMVIGIASSWLPLSDAHRRVRDLAIATVVAAVFLCLGLGWYLAKPVEANNTTNAVAISAVQQTI